MFDLAILGGGPAGYVAAERAGAAGLSTILFEKKALGGVCLNEGCIPTKTLLYSAKLYHYALEGKRFGVHSADTAYDYAEFLKRKDKVVRKLVAGVKAAMKNAAVEVVAENAEIISRDAEGTVLAAAGKEYRAGRLLICTGSEAFVPPFPGLAEAGDKVLTSRELLSLNEVPRALTVIGGGVIGMEFAALFNTLGTEVTVVEMLPKILGPMDGEISALLQKIYAKRGIHFCLGCKVSGIEDGAVVYEDPEGNVCRAAGDKILVAAGRRPVLTGYGLERLGVELGRGIKVDDRMRTSVPGVWAAGDVTGLSMLAHSASREAEVAVADMLGKDDRMHYDAIPGIVYTNPEVAGVGITGEQAGPEHEILKLPMAYSGRFVAENEGGEGLCKIIAEKGSRRVVGVHMLGNPCSEIIQGACIAIEAGMTVDQLRKVVFPHPTVSEIIKETAWQSANN